MNLPKNYQELLAFLSGKKIEPGVHARLVESLPVNQTLTIEIDAELISLGFSAAEYVHVERQN